MVKRHANYLDTQQQFNISFSCSTCHSHIISQQDIVSKAFQGRHGAAFLVNKVVNMMIGNQEERMLMTGLHTVADISCQVCKSKIGWIYIEAPEANQKYKEGKCVIEKTKVIKECFY